MAPNDFHRVSLLLYHHPKGTKQCEFKRQGMRWCVEAQTGDDGVVEVAVTDVKHSVNVYGCFEVTFKIVMC